MVVAVLVLKVAIDTRGWLRGLQVPIARLRHPLQLP